MSIHINPKHKGEFTAEAKAHGKSVHQFAEYVMHHKNKEPVAVRKRASFALEAESHFGKKR